MSKPTHVAMDWSIDVMINNDNISKAQRRSSASVSRLAYKDLSKPFAVAALDLPKQTRNPNVTWSNNYQCRHVHAWIVGLTPKH